MKNVFRLILISSTLTLCGCVASLPVTHTLESGTYRAETEMRFNGTPRKFLLHLPPGSEMAEPLPLVLVLHGAFSNAKQTEQETGFSKLADQKQFLVAYPEGIGVFGLLQHWNAGHCCGKAAKDKVDDVGFVSAVIATIKQRFTVDQSRIYLAGMSNGGMLTYRYAAEHGQELAAIAVVSGAIGSTEGDPSTDWAMPAPVQPLPVISFHGTGDEHIPVGGGPSPLKGGERSYLSVDNAMEYWRLADGCSKEPVSSVERDGNVRHFFWEDCTDGHQVEYYLLENWGHKWPASYFTADLAEDDPLLDFDATEYIWSFFSNHQH